MGTAIDFPFVTPVAGPGMLGTNHSAAVMARLAMPGTDQFGTLDTSFEVLPTNRPAALDALPHALGTDRLAAKVAEHPMQGAQGLMALDTTRQVFRAEGSPTHAAQASA